MSCMNSVKKLQILYFSKKKKKKIKKLKNDEKNWLKTASYAYYSG